MKNNVKKYLEQAIPMMPNSFERRIDEALESLAFPKMIENKGYRWFHNKRVLTAVCIVLAFLSVAATVLSIPSARAMVFELFGARQYNVTDYLGENQESRDSAQVNDLIQKVAPTNATVTEVGKGFEHYRDIFGVQLDEVLYDGTSLYATMTLKGEFGVWLLEANRGGTSTHMKVEDQYVADYFDDSLDPKKWKAEDESLYVHMESTVSMKMGNGQEAIGVITLAKIEDYDTLVGENEEQTSALIAEYVKTHDVKAVVRLFAKGGGPMRFAEDTKKVSADLKMQLFYRLNGDTGAERLVLNANLGQVEIDTKAYQKTIKAVEPKNSRISWNGSEILTLSDAYYVTHPGKEHDGNITYSCKRVSLEGITVEIYKIEFTATTMKVKVTFHFPENWSVEDCYSFVFLTRFTLYFNGEQKGYGAIVTGELEISEDLHTITKTLDVAGLSFKDFSKLKTVKVLPKLLFVKKIGPDYKTVWKEFKEGEHYTVETGVYCFAVKSQKIEYPDFTMEAYID